MRILGGGHPGEGTGAAQIRASHGSAEDKVKIALKDVIITPDNSNWSLLGSIL